MADSKEQEATMVRYLLGQSSEEERDHVEERYFSDGAFFDQLLAVEDSLIDDFVSGRMSADQIVAFQKSRSGRQDDIAFSRALFLAVTKKKLDPPAPLRKPRLSPSPQPRRVQTPLFRKALPIAAIALLVLSFALFLRNQSLRNSLSEIERQLAMLRTEREAADQQLGEARTKEEASAREAEVERNKRIDAEESLNKLARRESSSDVKTVVLTAAFLARGPTGTLREVRVSEGIRWLRFVVPVKRYIGYASFRLSIKLAGQPEALEIGSLKPKPASGELAITVSSSKLIAGDYILTLYGETPSAPPSVLEEYSFRTRY